MSTTMSTTDPDRTPPRFSFERPRSISDIAGSKLCPYHRRLLLNLKINLHENKISDRPVSKKSHVLDREVDRLRQIRSRNEATQLMRAAWNAGDFLELRSILHDIGFDIPAEEPNDLVVPEVYMDDVEERKIQRFKRNVEWEATREQREREVEENNWLYANDRYYFGDFETDEDRLNRELEETPLTADELAEIEKYERETNTPEEKAKGKIVQKLMLEARLRSRDKEGIKTMLLIRGFDLDNCDEPSEGLEIPDIT